MKVEGNQQDISSIWDLLTNLATQEEVKVKTDAEVQESKTLQKK